MVKLSDIKKEQEMKNDQETSLSGGNRISTKFFTKKPKQFNDKFKERFFSELALLIASGIDMHTAMNLIKKGFTKENEKAVINLIFQKILEGNSFFQALIISEKFSAYDSASIRIGEETGQLHKILTELANYYNRKIKQRRLVFKAISYPVLVLLTALSSLIFMLSYVVPMFEEIFFRSNNELPAFTGYIIGVSKFFREHLIIVLGAFMSLFIAGFLMKRNRMFTKYLEMGLLKIPLIGQPLKMYFMEKLFHSLAILIHAKVPVHEALSLVKNIIHFRPMQASIQRIMDDVLGGETLANAIEKTGFFEQKTIVLVKIGEEVNKLDEIFAKLYTEISDRMEHLISTLGNTLEPLLIIMVGLLVAVILIAMYLPIFQLGTSVF